MKYIRVLLLCWIVFFTTGISVAQDTANKFFIIPEQSNSTTVVDAVKAVWSQWGKVWDTYNAKAAVLSSNLGDQLASGIMTRDTLIQYTIYLARFLSQIGLLIGACMIIYAGYIYAISIFSGGDASKGNNAIKYAIYGVVVIASAYAIMRILTSAFL